MIPHFYSATEVERLLDYTGCAAAVKEAMIALSTSEVDQPLRQIVDLHDKRLFGVMPGKLLTLNRFGAKLVSVFGDPDNPGRSRHRGVVLLYDGHSGEVKCIADAEPITAIRTACASAVATAALARHDARTSAVFGTGAQAETHVRVLALTRPADEILLWGRSPAKTRSLAERLSAETGHSVIPVETARDAAERADIICTVSSASQPIVKREWVRPGTHFNLVGSSFLGPVEIDSALVAASRYVADYRPSVLAQGSELAVARAEGLVDDSHVVGEIGEILAGKIPGRERDDQITIYKSLGHVVQDLAAAAYVHDKASKEG